MGLKEKRAVETFKTEKLKGFTDAAEKITGAPLNFDIKWDTFLDQIEGYSDANETFEAYMRNVFFKPLDAALSSICSDDMGRSAIKSALTKIEMFNTGNYSDGSGAHFDGSTLKLDFKYANEGDVEARAKAIQKQLEDKL
jgi:hypothetical protein